ncbi:hypothetical protein [Segniliparus rugosus]|uniref:Uncharacterized protein n=1 Tax=Segniliparus rugosus (strain ATCC BAA-974 / DSM 45345 / CCUG 50838 / CIP 108380 / JCM 13579 / CDC 945) TaxID=679197 RepID=U1M1E6_SEGRC|nr:hypothetical protein [Segniliparus rugosus]ERG69207.1 hypothetical protein HMPREF9336_04351 [Segniliparus rugosus ATCC BAA-974]
MLSSALGEIPLAAVLIGGTARVVWLGGDPPRSGRVSRFVNRWR